MPIFDNVDVTVIDTKIILRNDVTENWATSTLVLEKGEPALEMDLEKKVAKLKVGDGTSTFNDLPYSTMTPDEIQELINNSMTEGGAVNSVELKAGSVNGSVKLVVNGIESDDIVVVSGLGSAAYTESSEYATAAQGERADNAMVFKGTVDVLPTEGVVVGDTYVAGDKIAISSDDSQTGELVEASVGDLIIAMADAKWLVIAIGKGGEVITVATRLEKGISAELTGGVTGSAAEANAGETMNIEVTAVNTDYLSNGVKVLILNGGSAASE